MVQPTRVTQVVSSPVTAPERRGRGSTVDALSGLCCHIRTTRTENVSGKFTHSRMKERESGLTWSGNPHLTVEFGREGGVDPGAGGGVEGGGVVILRRCHVRAVGSQHVRVGRWTVHTPGSVAQIQETATAPQSAWRAQTLHLQAVLQLGALPALSAGRGVPLSGGGERRGVEGAVGVRVRGRLGERAAAPGGGRRVVRRAQGVAPRPVQQLQVAEGAGGAQHLSDCGEQMDEVTHGREASDRCRLLARAGG